MYTYLYYKTNYLVTKKTTSRATESFNATFQWDLADILDDELCQMFNTLSPAYLKIWHVVWAQEWVIS
jgi:hypothetical protein